MERGDRVEVRIAVCLIELVIEEGKVFGNREIGNAWFMVRGVASDPILLVWPITGSTLKEDDKMRPLVASSSETVAVVVAVGIVLGGPPVTAKGLTLPAYLAVDALLKLERSVLGYLLVTSLLWRDWEVGGLGEWRAREEVEGRLMVAVPGQWCKRCWIKMVLRRSVQWECLVGVTVGRSRLNGGVLTADVIFYVEGGFDGCPERW
ncbi:hypothetical protein HNY73_011576 [Argiope bruennichi]|uniref:Uncharacterized protein n=1 Tax=Argiope bruennichi TaxID=94029 RepID=A0A8T0F1H3_ARGBR|nr:hypothetical protein HNY73_011576 [Argiope bruennichi]